MKQSMAEIEKGYVNWEQPTLIFWGMKDPWLASNHAQEFVKVLKNGELVEFEEAGHYPQEHWAGKFSEVLLPFLRRQTL